jgi:hypothetical protein
MIPKYRNRGILQIVIAVIMAVVFTVGLMWVRSNHKHGEVMSDASFVFWLFFYLGTVAMWVAGGFSLAMAKGYHSDAVGCLFVVSYLAGVLVPLFPLFFPIIVAFGLKDKLRSRKRRMKRDARQPTPPDVP